jgi:hypothetical protein
MMYFLQDPKESDALEVEIAELKSELKNNPMHDKYVVVNSSYFNDHKEVGIPVGSIEFVQKYLNEVHGINHMNPIEIPQCLRLPHLLLRDYKIVPYDQIPRIGEYFIKDVSRLKGWTYQGNMSGLFSKELNKEDIDKSHLFQVSELLDIVSEYRVIVEDTRIYGIQFYNGDPLIMPNEKEIRKIQEMVLRYSVGDKTRPLAYTMDVAIVIDANDGHRNLALIEVHPFVSVGTYGCRGSFLPRMYKQGVRWYIELNTPIEK